MHHRQGGMDMDIEELRRQASQWGIDFGLSTRKPVLIRAIQRRQGDLPCFGSDQRFACRNFRCPWRADCLKPIAEWRR